MKLLNTWFALILIVSALHLSAAKNGVLAQTNNLPTARNSQHEKPEQDQAQTQESPTPSTVLSGSAASSQPSPTSKAKDSASNPQSWDDWFWQNFAPLLLAVLAIWAGCIALSTLDAIREQGQTARDALTKLERAWVFIIPKTAWLYGPSDDTVNSISLVSLEIEINNSGRSPAWLIGGSARTLRKRESPLPDMPEYSSDEPQSPVIVATSVVHPPQWLRTTLTYEQLDEFIGGTLTVCAYGILHYRDVFGDSHETRYCIEVSPPLFDAPKTGEKKECWAHFSGPEAYNRNT